MRLADARVSSILLRVFATAMAFSSQFRPAKVYLDPNISRIATPSVPADCGWTSSATA